MKTKNHIFFNFHLYDKLHQYLRFSDFEVTPNYTISFRNEIVKI